MSLNKIKTLLILNKTIVIEIIFYLHLTVGFLIASFVAVYFEIDHAQVAFIWSVIFIALLIHKTKEKMKK